MKKLIGFGISLSLCISLFAQNVGIGTNTPAASAALDVSSSSKGFLPPRMSYAEIMNIANPANGLLVYDTDIDAYRSYKRNRWVILTEKEKELSDPPGEFTTPLNAYGGAASEGNAVAIAPDGSGYVVAGTFNTSLKITDNLFLTGTANTGSATRNVFMVRYAMNGSVIWAKSLVSTSPMELNSMTIDNKGKVIITGLFDAAVDFDPGPGIAQLTPSGTSTMFIAKYDSLGNYIWAKMAGTFIYPASITTDTNGDIFIGGNFYGTTDFAPGTPVANFTASPAGYSNGFFLRYDSTGSYIWNNVLTGTSYRKLNCIDLYGGNIYVCGEFQGIIDLDPSAGAAFNITSTGNYDIYWSKYSTLAGSYISGSGNRIGGSSVDNCNAIAVNDAGQVGLVGTFSGTVDFDPSAASQTRTATASNNNSFLAFYSSAASFIAVTILEGGNNEALSLKLIDNEFYIAGTLRETVEFDPLSYSDAFLSATGGLYTDCYLANYTWTSGSSIAFNWAKTAGSNGNDLTAGLDVASYGSGKKIISTGYMGFHKWKTYEGAIIDVTPVLSGGHNMFFSVYTE